jgi:hypothetical protein
MVLDGIALRIDYREDGTDRSRDQNRHARNEKTVTAGK